MSPPMERVGFKIKVCNQDFDAYILFTDESAWIWVGTDRIESLGLAYYPMFTMLEDAGNTQRDLLRCISTRLAKGSRFKQVFLSTDIENENPIFWKELDEKLRAELTQLTTIQL